RHVQIHLRRIDVSKRISPLPNGFKEVLNAVLDQLRAIAQFYPDSVHGVKVHCAEDLKTFLLSLHQPFPHCFATFCSLFPTLHIIIHRSKRLTLSPSTGTTLKPDRTMN